MTKTRFIFDREMTKDQIDDAILKMAKEHGIALADDPENKAEVSKKRKKEVKHR